MVKLAALILFLAGTVVCEELKKYAGDCFSCLIDQQDHYYCQELNKCFNTENEAITKCTKNNINQWYSTYLQCPLKPSGWKIIGQFGVGHWCAISSVPERDMGLLKDRIFIDETSVTKS